MSFSTNIQAIKQQISQTRRTVSQTLHGWNQFIERVSHGWNQSAKWALFAALLGLLFSAIDVWPAIQEYISGPPLPGIKTVEVFMDDNTIAEHEISSKPLHLSNFVALMADKPVRLRVMVTDTNDEPYTVNEMECNWSVAPSNKSISSDKCEIVFIPEKSYSKQIVGVAIVSGEKFKPVPTISMEFDIK